MTDLAIKQNTHPPETKIADFLEGSLPPEERAIIEEHMAYCGECLEKAVSAYESVGLFRGNKHDKGRNGFMKKLNFYLVFAVIAFALSFVMPRYFIQLLVATLLLGIKWITDSKSTKMLVMIYEAWKKGGEKEASRILETFDSESKSKSRF